MATKDDNKTCCQEENQAIFKAPEIAAPPKQPPKITALRERVKTNAEVVHIHKHYAKDQEKQRLYHGLLACTQMAMLMRGYYDIWVGDSLIALQEAVGSWRTYQGFDTRWGNTMEKLMLIVTELSEAAEGFRHLTPDFIRGLERGDNPTKETLEDIIDASENMPDPEGERRKAAKEADALLTQWEWRDNVEEELADTAIRLLDLCDALDINLTEAIHRKMAINELRLPKHGKER